LAFYLEAITISFTVGDVLHNAVAAMTNVGVPQELQLPLLKVAATELVAGVSGESEERIRELFDQAVSSAPCVLFLDEIDAIAPHRATAQREMERRIVAQLLSSMDGEKHMCTSLVLKV
jgi:SpoVK/Ycf46/Vps4 family AAA+-type ATPase